MVDNDTIHATKDLNENGNGEFYDFFNSFVSEIMPDYEENREEHIFEHPVQNDESKVDSENEPKDSINSLIIPEYAVVDPIAENNLMTKTKDEFTRNEDNEQIDVHNQTIISNNLDETIPEQEGIENKLEESFGAKENHEATTQAELFEEGKTAHEIVDAPTDDVQENLDNETIAEVPIDEINSKTPKMLGIL